MRSAQLRGTQVHDLLDELLRYDVRDFRDFRRGLWHRLACDLLLHDALRHVL